MARIRPFIVSDTPQIVALFCGTVRRVNCRDYSPSQISAWAPDAMDLTAWKERLSGSYTVVAITGSESPDPSAEKVVGFANLADDGYVDCFYVHADHQREGIGRLLMTALQQQACEQKLRRLYAAVSITACPAFERLGFRVVAPETVERNGQMFDRFQMEQILNAADA